MERSREEPPIKLVVVEGLFKYAATSDCASGYSSSESALRRKTWVRVWPNQRLVETTLSGGTEATVNEVSPKRIVVSGNTKSWRWIDILVDKMPTQVTG